MPNRVHLPIGTWHLRGTLFEERQLVECPACGTRYFDRVVDLTSQAQMFDGKSVGAKWAGERRAVAQAGRVINLAKERRIDRPRILDIGCNTGVFLAALPSSWRKIGVEINPSAARLAADRVVGAEIHTGSFGEMDLAQSNFDLIVAWDVLEHVPDPVPWLQNVERLLGPEGSFLFETGNVSSPFARLAGLAWYYYSILDHSVFYGRRSIVRLIEMVNLRIITLQDTVHAHSLDLSSTALAVERLKATLVIGYSLRGRLRLFHAAVARGLGKDGTLPHPYLRDHMLVESRRN